MACSEQHAGGQRGEHQDRPTTYVGHLSARVRDILWTETLPLLGSGRATLVYADSNEQGFTIQTAGEGRYTEPSPGLVTGSKPREGGCCASTEEVPAGAP